jgi:hypothetical protein
MDCTSARSLLSLVRANELDAAETKSLEGHLSGCADCAAFAQAENDFDNALETAMIRVPMPEGLKARILRHVTSARRPRPWRWAAAATVLAAIGLGGYLVLTSGPEDFDAARFVENQVDIKASPESVEAWLSSQLGIEVTAPREFNFNLLDGQDIAVVQGCKVGKLTFRSESRAALAHVYIMPTRQFNVPALQQADGAMRSDWPDDISIPASTHNVRIRRSSNVTDFFYLIVYTSASLEPFLLQGI